eukprot:1209813-Pyramimonas_sp.AAC.1
MSPADVRLSMTKDILFGASGMVKTECGKKKTTTTPEQIAWMLATLRAMRRGGFQILRRAARAFEVINQYVDVESHMWMDLEGFHSLLGQLSHDNLDELLK